MKRHALVLALLCAACGKPAANAEPVENEAPSASTRWVRAEPARGAAWLEAPARVLAAPEATAVVSVPLTAHVLRVRVRPGQVVKAGDPLVDVLMPELARAAGALAAADIRLDAYQKRRERLAPLVQEGLARAAEMAELDANIAMARADRESARSTLRAAGISEGQVDALRSGNGTLALRAPISGMVVNVSAHVGEMREPGGGPLVELVGSAAVQIEARLTMEPPPGIGFAWLAQEQTVPLVLDAISPRAAGPEGARLAWFHVVEGREPPAPGTLGRVRLELPADWLAVPARALLSVDGKTEVKARSGDREAPTPVEVKMRTNSEAVVTGLAPGTLVAADASRTEEPPR